MKAAVWHARHDVRVDRLADPGPPGPGEVLVESAFGGICGSDLHEVTDGPIFFPKDAQGIARPSILGHEFSGTVRAVGEGVQRVRPGHRVAVHPCQQCGTCRFCLDGSPHFCPTALWMGLGAVGGGLARYNICKEWQLFPLPDNVSLEQGALVEPAAVAMNAAERGGIRPGDVVLVTGGGPIGQVAAMTAKALGAGAVYLSEVAPFRREMAARAAEPTRVFDPSRENLVQAMRELTGGWGVDVALEASASEPALHDALASTRRDGTVVQIGLFGRPITFHPSDELIVTARRFIGSLGYSPRSFERVIGLMEEGRLPAERIVTAVIDVDDVMELGIEELGRKDTKHAKILVRPTE